MILNITDKCLMGCTHCSERCTPLGEHMTMETFKESLKFITKINPTIILVSGGEPTLHPNFIEIMNELKRRFKPNERICITSNGMFLEDNEYAEQILDLGIPIQICADPRYYPIKIPVVKHKNLIYETHVRQIYPLGRALDNNIPNEGIPPKAPKCFNLRSIAQNYNQLSEIVRTLEINGKFCTPSISINGDLRAGEFNSCNSFGNVKDNPLTLARNLKAFRCNNCGVEDVLSPLHRFIINGGGY